MNEMLLISNALHYFFTEKNEYVTLMHYFYNELCPNYIIRYIFNFLFPCTLCDLILVYYCLAAVLDTARTLLKNHSNRLMMILLAKIKKRKPVSFF